MDMSYYVIKSAIETNKPKVVMLDPGKGKKSTAGTAHKSIDALPMGKTKNEAIEYLMGIDATDEKLDFISAMWAYHMRIFELGKYDFNITYSKDNGASVGTRIYEGAEEPTMKNVEGSVEGKEDMFELYKKIIALCKENDVDFVMTVFPTSDKSYGEGRCSYQKVLADYTLEQGCKVLDMNTDIDGIGLDYRYDFANGTHLNKIGAAKTSDYLAKYLIDNCGIEDHRSDENYKSWEKGREEFTDENIFFLKNENEIVRTVLRAADKNLHSELYIKDKMLLDSIYGLKEAIKFNDTLKVMDDSGILAENQDALIRVYDKDGKLVCEKPFIYNTSEKWLTVGAKEPSSVNLFPEVDDD